MSKLNFFSVYGSGRLTAHLGPKHGSVAASMAPNAKRLLFNLLLKLTTPLAALGVALVYKFVEPQTSIWQQFVTTGNCR